MEKRYLILSLSLILLFSALSVSAAEFTFDQEGKKIADYNVETVEEI